VIGVKRCVWTVDYSADTYIDVLNTYSGHIAWEQWKRDQTIRRGSQADHAAPRSRIRKHYLSILQVCRRISVTTEDVHESFDGWRMSVRPRQVSSRG